MTDNEIISLIEDESRYLELVALLRMMALIDETLSVTNPELASRVVKAFNHVIAQRLSVVSPELDSRVAETMIAQSVADPEMSRVVETANRVIAQRLNDSKFVRRLT
jgi:flagellar biosynthesis/type III secretory pathway protein FliH